METGIRCDDEVDFPASPLMNRGNLSHRKKNKQTDCVLVDQEDFENKQFTKLLGVQAEVPSPETDPCEPKLRKHAISLEQRLLPQQ